MVEKHGFLSHPKARISHRTETITLQILREDQESGTFLGFLEPFLFAHFHFFQVSVSESNCKHSSGEGSHHLELQTPEEFRMYQGRQEIREKQYGIYNPLMSPGG